MKISMVDISSKKDIKRTATAARLDIEDFIGNPSSAEHMISTTTKCWEDRTNIRAKLKSQMKITKKAAQQGFDILANQ